MTNIKEEEYEKKINISKFDFSCDDEDLTIPEPLPRKSFSMLIVGKPGMGKTNLLLNLITKQGKAFNKKFDKYKEATFDALENFISQVDNSGEKVLLILDDVIADVRGKGKAEIENKLQKIFFNRRHLCGAGGSCSIIATSQTYTKIDPKLRKSCSQLILFENRNKRECESVFSEAILIPQKEFYDVMKYIYDKKHNFMYLDTTKSQDDMIHKNFNKLVIDSPNIMKF